jgi:hypothetical protein
MPKEKETQTQGQEDVHRPYEEWAAEKGTPTWLLAAARAKAGWALGQEVTEKEYDRAVEAALKEVIR